MLKLIALFFIVPIICCTSSGLFIKEPEITDMDLAKIQIFFEPPDAPFTVIGTIAGDDDDYEELIEDLQERTIEMGGNAFIVINQNKGRESSTVITGVADGAVVGASSDNDKTNYLVQVIKLLKSQ